MKQHLLVSPGWYAVPRQEPWVLHSLREAGFEFIFSWGYSYAQVTLQNRLAYQAIVRERKFMRIKDIEAKELLTGLLAKAAVERYPGSKKEGCFTKKDVLDLLENQDNLCVGCSLDITLCFTIDHIVPRSFGGSNNVANIQLLCKSCNSSKSDRSMEEWLTSQQYDAEVTRYGELIKVIAREPFKSGDNLEINQGKHTGLLAKCIQDIGKEKILALVLLPKKPERLWLLASNCSLTNRVVELPPKRKRGRRGGKYTRQFKPFAPVVSA